jgi:hypothetical protein
MMESDRRDDVNQLPEDNAHNPPARSNPRSHHAYRFQHITLFKPRFCLVLLDDRHVAFAGETFFCE